MSEAELLNWGPLILFGWAIVHPTGVMFLAVACEKHPILLKMMKMAVYLGFVVGIILFGNILQASINVMPKVLGETTGKGSVFIFSLLFICWLVPSLTNGILFKMIFQQKWETYVRLMRSKQ